MAARVKVMVNSDIAYLWWNVPKKVWFSPNTKTKTKGTAVPVDMAEVFAAVEGAKTAVLFLLFNPGAPSIIDKVKTVAKAREKAGKFLYVRGAISDPKTATEGAVRIFSRSATAPADTVVAGVAGCRTTSATGNASC